MRMKKEMWRLITISEKEVFGILIKKNQNNFFQLKNHFVNNFSLNLINYLKLYH